MKKEVDARPSVVFDTNALISHIWGSPNMVRIMRAMRDNRLTPVVSPEIIEEFKDVMSRPKIRDRIGELAPRIFLREYIEFSHVVNPKRSVTACEADAKDNMVLECGWEGKADYIVTGDGHLLSMKIFEGTRILCPADFLREVIDKQ